MDSHEGLKDTDYPAGAKSAEFDHRVVGFLPDIVILMTTTSYANHGACADGCS